MLGRCPYRLALHRVLHCISQLVLASCYLSRDCSLKLLEVPFRLVGLLQLLVQSMVAGGVISAEAIRPFQVTGYAQL